jgi:hypothetical protein
MALLMALVGDRLMGETDEQKRQLADVFDAVEGAAGGLGEILQEAKILDRKSVV